MNIEAFVSRWEASGASERANYVLFLTELCDLLEVPRPEPTQPDERNNAYVFEKSVTFRDGDGGGESVGRIDLYKRGCFVLEAKQGSDAAVSGSITGASSYLGLPKPRLKKGTAVRQSAAWDGAMTAARGQAELYARALPAEEGWPPFLIVVDVGYSFELFADFTRIGKTYLPFPDAASFRIPLRDLAREEIRDRLRNAWTDPLGLDPSRRSARVTRDLAARLAKLASSLERNGHAPEAVSTFLMRCLFTMFAEDVELIERGTFTSLLDSLRGQCRIFPEMVASLWKSMNEGGFSPILRKKLLRFDGSLFADQTALPLTEPELELLIEAAKADWKDVEPAIFGTLLERALDPRERHALGAHYTPRAYVERLVLPTVVEPVREEWRNVHAAAVSLATKGDLKAALAEVRAFHRRLCAIRVLDPACGSGNFLYVTLEHLKRLEGEVFDALAGFGERQGLLELEGAIVDPHQFLGIEVNPRAAAIAEMVLWIGYLQWHFRTHGRTMPPEPVLRKFDNIQCRDAVLEWDAVTPRLDADGKPLTRWDGITMKSHPATGRPVPDETARVPVSDYANPRPASWPDADFVVGNPPFIGTARMRDALGDGYAEALRRAHQDVPDSADFVMFWWNHAAGLARAGKIERFGFIATNSLRQTFNRRVIQAHLDGAPPLGIAFAIPDHPWVDAAEGAAVRISMTVGRRCDAPGDRPGKLLIVRDERETGEDALEVTFNETIGIVHADLTTGAELTTVKQLQSNLDLSNRGVCLFGSGFIVTLEKAVELGLGRISGLDRYIRLYRNGKDLTSTPRGVMVIDLYGLSADETRSLYPEVYQHVLEHVKPERDQNNRESRKKYWWLFGETNPKLREMLMGLSRYISTVETSKHRFFTFLDAAILPDNMLVNIALDDAYVLGILSSRAHVVWALAAGGRLGVGNDPRYNKTRCFEPFPFPVCDETTQNGIRELGERLDAHRKRQQERFPKLTLTEMYNVLEKVRRGEGLTAKEKTVHEQGLIEVLRELHDDLDRAVFAAYGWPGMLSDEEILKRLTALNAERAAEEAAGTIRWLRPEYQNPGGTAGALQSRSAETAETPDEPGDAGEADAQGADADTETDSESGAGTGTVTPSRGRKPRTARGKTPRAADRAGDSPESPEARSEEAKPQAVLPWPKLLADRVQAVRAALAAEKRGLDLPGLAARFKGARADQLAEILTTLVSLGLVRLTPTGCYRSR